MMRPPLLPLLVGLLVVGTPVCVGVNPRGARNRAIGVLVPVAFAGAAWVGCNDIPVRINTHIPMNILINIIWCLKRCCILVLCHSCNGVYYARIIIAHTQNFCFE